MSPPIIKSRWGHSNGEFLGLSGHYKKGKSQQQARFHEIKSDASEGILMHTSAPLTLIENRHGHFCCNLQRFQKHICAEGAKLYYANRTIWVIEAYEIFIGTNITKRPHLFMIGIQTSSRCFRRCHE